MNHKQKVVMWLGILALTIAFIVPPWNGLMIQNTNGSVVRRDYVGYSLITKPPKIYRDYTKAKYDKYHMYSLDWIRLSITVGMILLITVGLLLSYKESTSNISEHKG